jgi:hypothetical protein
MVCPEIAEQLDSDKILVHSAPPGTADRLALAFPRKAQVDRLAGERHQSDSSAGCIHSALIPCPLLRDAGLPHMGQTDCADPQSAATTQSKPERTSRRVADARVSVSLAAARLAVRRAWLGRGRRRG